MTAHDRFAVRTAELCREAGIDLGAGQLARSLAEARRLEAAGPYREIVRICGMDGTARDYDDSRMISR